MGNTCPLNVPPIHGTFSAVENKEGFFNHSVKVDVNRESLRIKV